MSINYEKWVKTALDEENFSREDAVTILEDSGVDILQLAAAAGEVRMAIVSITNRSP